MDAVILSAGYGKRLLPITRFYQKAVLGVYGIPPLLYQIYNLKQKGIKQFFINMHHGKDTLKKLLAAFLPPDGDTAVNLIEENEILGTGGALVNLRKLLSDDFLVINGDSYLDIDLDSFYRFFKQSGCVSALMLGDRENRNISGIGMKAGLINCIDIRKQAKLPYMFYGCHLINRKIFDICSRSGYADIITDIYSTLIKERLLAGYGVKKPLFDIGTFSNIREGLRDLTGSSFEVINLKDFCTYDPKGNSLYFNTCPDTSPERIINSTLSFDVRVSKKARIKNSVIMQNNYIGPEERISESVVPPGFFSSCLCSEQR